MSPQDGAPPADRFDMLVRADLFAGAGSDEARLARGFAVRNYEQVIELQKDTFRPLGDHPKGEWLFRIVEGHSRPGDAASARRL